VRFAKIRGSWLKRSIDRFNEYVIHVYFDLIDHMDRIWKNIFYEIVNSHFLFIRKLGEINDP